MVIEQENRFVTLNFEDIIEVILKDNNIKFNYIDGTSTIIFSDSKEDAKKFYENIMSKFRWYYSNKDKIANRLKVLLDQNMPNSFFNQKPIV